MKKVKVIKCSGDWWYKKEIGTIFEVAKEQIILPFSTFNKSEELNYQVVQNGEITRLLLDVNDCVVV